MGSTSAKAEIMRSDRRQRIADGRCRVWGCHERALPGLQSCLKHHNSRLDDNRKKRETQIRLGRCRYGACKKQVVGEYAYCPEHKLKKNAIDRYRVYGITQEQFNEMVLMQNGCCAICNLKPADRAHPKSCGQYRSLHVDHDHKTGKVRGLLCALCNLTIGHIEKNHNHLERMFSYMREHGILPV